ncbi:MAG: hypothetical protein ACAH88_16445 [Roseimicrobium sp.]
MHEALTIKRDVKRSWQAPLAVDSLLHYSMLGGCLACLLASLVCFSWVWLDEGDLLTVESKFPFVRASDGEIASALAVPASGVIEVREDYSVMLDGRIVGTGFDAKLSQLTFAIWARKKDASTTAQVVIHVPPQIQHGRIVNVLSALERANTREFILLFAGRSQDEPVWKGRR